MGLKIKGLDRVRKNFSRTESKVRQGSLEGLRAAAAIVVEEARKNAPVETQELEKAIVANETRERTALGRFGQIQIQVGVDVSKLDLSKHAGFDYSIRMHEDPNYNLGPLSEAKQNSGGNTVGYKFLTRALKDKEKECREVMAEAVKRSVP